MECFHQIINRCWKVSAPHAKVMLIIDVPKLANSKSITSESKAHVVVMQAVCLLNGPLCERRHSAQTDRVTTRRRSDPPAVIIDTLFSKHNSKDLIKILHRYRKVQSTEWDMHWERQTLSHEADDRPVSSRSWQEVRALRCHSCQRCNSCAMCSV